MRLDASTKIIVSRAKQDNARLIRLNDPQHDAVPKVADHPGPTVILPCGGPDPAIHPAAAICAGYTSKRRDYR
ncbi:MAG: hypothetical protein KJP07_14325 [Desulfatitalea sp.]|nr:hypothetical protein [Desulfatitalea sp.]